MTSHKTTSDASQYHLGVDIGGTHFRMGVCRGDGKILAKESIATKSLSSASDALEQLAKKLDPDHEIPHVVLGVPGVVDYHDRHVVFAPNIPQDFLPELSASIVEKLLGRSVHLVNDADLAGIGEAYFGAGKDSAAMAYVTVSTGVGASVIYRGKVLHTKFSLAELGHSFIESTKATRQGDGSVEFEASGTALGAMVKAANLDLSNAEVVERAVHGDQPCIELIDALSHAAAVALANMIHLFSIELVVLGGGVILSSDLVFDRITQYFHELRPSYLPVTITRAILGDDAGLVGAAGAELAF